MDDDDAELADPTVHRGDPPLRGQLDPESDEAFIIASFLANVQPAREKAAITIDGHASTSMATCGDMHTFFDTAPASVSLADDKARTQDEVVHAHALWADVRDDAGSDIIATGGDTACGNQDIFKSHAGDATSTSGRSMGKVSATTSAVGTFAPEACDSPTFVKPWTGKSTTLEGLVQLECVW